MTSGQVTGDKWPLQHLLEMISNIKIVINFNRKENMAIKETFKVKGDEVVGKVKQAIKEGNARRIIIKKPNGEEVARFSLTMGVVGAALAPILAAVGAVAAVLSSCTIVVEKNEKNKSVSN